MRKYFFAMFLLATIGTANAQPFVYAWHGAAANVQYRSTVTSDAFVYAIGQGPSAQSVDMDPTIGQQLIFDPTHAVSFLLKMSADGFFHWAAHIKGSNLTLGSIAVTSTGVIAVSGDADSVDLDLDPGPGVVASHSGVARVAFIAFYSSQADYLGHIEYDADRIYLRSLAVDAGDNLYFAGLLRDSIDMDFGAGTDIRPIEDPTAFVAKINTHTQEYVSCHVFKPSPGQLSDATDLDARGDKIVVLGRADGHQLDLDPTSGVFMGQNGAIDSSYTFAFYTLMDSSGAFVNAGTMGFRDDTLNPHGIAIDHLGRISCIVSPSSGADTILVTSHGIHTRLAVPGGNADFLLHFDETGDLSWHKTFAKVAGTGWTAITTNDSTVAVVGKVQDSITIGDGTTTLTFGPYQAQTTSRSLALFEATVGTLFGINVDEPMVVPTSWMASGAWDVATGPSNSFFIAGWTFYCPCEYDLDPDVGVASTSATDPLMFTQGGGYLLRLNLDGIVQRADPPAPSPMSVSPNPATDRLVVRADAPLHAAVVRDLQGRVLKTMTSDPVQSIDIDIASLPAGMYLIELHGQSGVASARFVKH